MDLSTTELGPFILYTIETGRFRLDGGAMFGVVPKTLWSRRITPDDQNRIPMAMRCLLIESRETGRIYLVDNGSGTKFSDKYEQIYQIDYSHSTLQRSLAHHGFEPGQVTDLIFTHLHFDHCGGTTYRDEAGELAHTFPNARYHVTDTHWETANHPNAREKASFFPENIEPIGDSGRLNLVGAEHRYEEGLSTIVVNGHTLGQQLPVLTEGDTKLVFAADLLPTAAHVPLPWVMGYDMRPIRTLEEKKELLERAAAEEWYFYLEHDADNELIQINRDEGRFSATTGLQLGDIG